MYQTQQQAAAPSSRKLAFLGLFCLGFTFGLLFLNVFPFSCSSGRYFSLKGLRADQSAEGVPPAAIVAQTELSIAPKPIATIASPNISKLCSCGVIKTTFDSMVHVSTDINEHMENLRALAAEVEHVTELGVRFVGGSSWSFAMAGVDRACKGLPYRINAGDITRRPQVSPYERTLHDCGLDYTFREGDDLLLEFMPTDLLFIDTWHVYRQLIKELHKLEPIARKYIALHDTTSFASRDEDVAGHGGKSENSSLYSGLAPKVGLWTAVEEFLSINKKWKLKHRYVHNNGVTVLERVSVVTQYSR